MKAYTFNFYTRPCSFENGHIVITLDIFSNTTSNNETKVMTWNNAKAYFQEYVRKQVGPVACYMHIVGSGRLPPGYKMFNNQICKDAGE